MAGLLDGIFGGGSGVMNYSPAAPPMTEYNPPNAQPPGFFDRLNSGLNSPLTQFGLGLASGSTPQEGFKNALQAQLQRSKIEHEKMTNAMKEYQYSVATGGFKGTFPQFLQEISANGDKSALTPTYVQKPDGTIEAWQLHSKGGGSRLDFGGAQPTIPYKPIDTGQGHLMAPSRGAPGMPLPGGATVPSDPTQPQGTYIPKDLQGANQQKKLGTETAVAIQRLPAIESTTERALNRLDALQKHPGMEAATGFFAGKLPFAPTPAARDFVARVEEVQGESWTQGIETMRGLGALSDAEGKKIEQARSRLSARDVNTKDYKDALKDVADIMRTGRDNARKIATGKMKPYSVGDQAETPAQPAQRQKWDFGPDGTLQRQQ